MQIEIKGETFILLHQKALYWKNRKTMLISDLHLGKITHFRKSGIAMPSIAHTDNLSRLDELLAMYDTDRVFLLGDLFHHTYNTEWDRFASWRSQYASLAMKIMLGNHDRLPHHLLEAAQIDITQEWVENDFIFTHHPKNQDVEGAYIFAGHVHPVYSLRSGGSPALRLPCFVFDEHQAILPSFGVFTGGYEVAASTDRKIFVIGEREIFRV